MIKSMKVFFSIVLIMLPCRCFAQAQTLPDPHSLDAEQQQIESSIDTESAPPVGTLLQRHFPLNMREYYRHYPPGFVLAEGGCLEDAKYPEAVVHLGSGGKWPFGRCDSTHFRIPVLSCRDSSEATCHVLIKLGPGGRK